MVSYPFTLNHSIDSNDLADDNFLLEKFYSCIKCISACVQYRLCEKDLQYGNWYTKNVYIFFFFGGGEARGSFTFTYVNQSRFGKD